MKITGTGPLSTCKLEFNGHDHKLHVVMAKASTALVVDIKTADIDVNQSLAARTDYHEVDGLEPAVIKHGGKYLVLLGRDRVIAATKATVKARLVTSVALKDARIVELAPEEVARPAMPARWEANPRQDGERRPGYQGKNPRPASDRESWNRPSSNTLANAGPPPEKTRTFDHVPSATPRPAGSYPNRAQNGPRTAYSKPPTSKGYKY